MGEWGLFPKGKNLHRAQNGKPLKSPCILCFLILGAQVLVHKAGILMASLTVPPFLLAVSYQWLKAFPQIMFVLMFLFSLLNCPYGSRGTNRI